MHANKTTKTQERVIMYTLRERWHHFGRGGKIGVLTGDKVKVIKETWNRKSISSLPRQKPNVSFGQDFQYKTRRKLTVVQKSNPIICVTAKCSMKRPMLVIVSDNHEIHLRCFLSYCSPLFWKQLNYSSGCGQTPEQQDHQNNKQWRHFEEN